MTEAYWAAVPIVSSARCRRVCCRRTRGGRDTVHAPAVARAHRDGDTSGAAARTPASRSRRDGGSGMRLAGKVALISGGARGMGAVEARLFAREGCRVVFGDVLDAGGKGVEADIGKAGGEAVYVNLDVTQGGGWAAARGSADGGF